MTANITAAIRWLNVLMTFLVVGLHDVTMEPQLSVVYPHFVLLNILVFFISLLSVWFLALLVSRVRPVWRVLTGGRKTF